MKKKIKIISLALLIIGIFMLSLGYYLNTKKTTSDNNSKELESNTEEKTEPMTLDFTEKRKFKDNSYDNVDNIDIYEFSNEDYFIINKELKYQAIYRGIKGNLEDIYKEEESIKKLITDCFNTNVDNFNRTTIDGNDTLYFTFSFENEKYIYYVTNNNGTIVEAYIYGINIDTDEIVNYISTRISLITINEYYDNSLDISNFTKFSYELLNN